ncbi:MAG TPA: helix-turn-helix domain-containing protein [Thermoflexales bacterium]|nr:helix-turn-helix domain-containing protein [Thermoflexales bacterium]
MDFAPPFGTWLKARRKQLDLTQAALAQRAHYSTIAIHKVEAGAQPTSHALAAALAAALDIPQADRAAFIAFARGLQVRQPLNHLPLPPTAMLGREADLATLSSLLAPAGSERLVTLLGPPGVGKTRLALQIAREMQPAFTDGAAFVPLAPLSDPAHLPGAILNALRQRTPGGAPGAGTMSLIEAISEFLESRELLLTLDNFEHLLHGAPLITGLLARCPRLRMLVTSRERLNLSGERVVELRSLARPDAIALFVRQAAAVKPGFASTPQNEAILDEICAHLDDLPLAIELAAARARMLTPARLLARLTDHAGARFELLNTGPRDADLRQRALSSTIDWSYRLLNEPEQRIFRRMSVFAGGCDLDGAAAVCLDPADKESPDIAAAETALQSLLDKSLIYEAEGLDGSARFNQLEMIREYALLQLTQSGEVDETLRRLAIHLNALGAASQPYVPKPNNIEWIKRLSSERDNIAAALAWCRTSAGDYSMGLLIAGRIGCAISWGASFGFATPLPGMDVWYERIEERIAALPDDVQAATLFGLEDLVHATGEWERARVVNELTRSVARRTGDWRVEADVLFADCVQHDYVEGDFARAEPVYLRMLELTRRDTLRHAVSLGMLGRALVAYRQAERAIPMLEAALAVWDEHNITWSMFGGQASIHEYLACAHMWRDDFGAAEAHARMALDAFAAAGLEPNVTPVRQAFSALAGGRAETFGACALQGLASGIVAQVRHLRPETGAITGLREIACMPHAAVHALRHTRGGLPDWVWRPALTWLGSLLAGVRCVPLALQMYGAAWASQAATTGDPRLAALTTRRLEPIRTAALADEALFEHWRAGERMSLDDVAAALEAFLEWPRTHTNDGRLIKADAPAVRGPRSAVKE